MQKSIFVALAIFLGTQTVVLGTPPESGKTTPPKDYSLLCEIELIELALQSGNFDGALSLLASQEPLASHQRIEAAARFLASARQKPTQEQFLAWTALLTPASLLAGAGIADELLQVRSFGENCLSRNKTSILEHGSEEISGS